MAFKKKTIAKEVQQNFKLLEDLPVIFSAGGGIQKYDEIGFARGLNESLRNLNAASNPLFDYSNYFSYQRAKALQSDLMTAKTQPQVTYRGVQNPFSNLPSSETAARFGLSPDSSYYDKAFLATSPNKAVFDRYGDDIRLEVMGSAGYRMPTRFDSIGGEVLYPAGNLFDVENYRVWANDSVSARLVDRNLSPKQIKSLKTDVLRSADDLFNTFQESSNVEVGRYNSNLFEYGQKFVDKKTGDIKSLDVVEGNALRLRAMDGTLEVLSVDDLKNRYEIKAPTDMKSFNQGDGLISNLSDLRYTVLGNEGDYVRLEGLRGDTTLMDRPRLKKEFRSNTLGFGTFPALTSGLLGTTGIVGGATAGKLLAKSLGANEEQQNIAAGIGGTLGGLTGVTTGYIGDGAKIPTSFQDMARSSLAARRDSNRQGFSSESGMVASNKKNNTGAIATSVNEPSRPKLTSDIIADYLKMMGGEPALIKPDGSQYNPNRKGRVNIGDRMTTAEKFGQAGDIGLNNDFTKLPEVHARFDDRQVALQVQKEIATGRLTTQKFYETPDKAIADQAAEEIRRSDGLLGRGESVEVRKLGKAYEVVAVRQYQPIPSRGNSAVRSYGLGNDPEGRFVAFNKPEEAYAAPKSLKELQREARQLEASGTQALAPDTRPEFKPQVQAQSNWEKLELPARSPMTEQLMQQALPEPSKVIASNTARDTGGWANAVGEPFSPPRKAPPVDAVDIKQPNFAAEMGLVANPTGITDRGYYNKVAATYANDNFGLGDRLKPFPDFYDLQRQAKAEGVRPEAFQNYIKGRANAPLIEAGIMAKPELPMTARLGQEYISPKSGKVGTVESVGKKGVKLNVDGQAVPVEYKTLEKLKYTGNKGFGFATPAALRPVFGGFIGGTAGSALFKQLAKSAGLSEEQQNQAAATGGIIGSFGGSALTNASANTKLRVPTAKEFAQTMVSTPQQRGAGARLFDLATDESAIFSKADRTNILNNKLPQYDIKPVLSEAAVIAVDMATPSPYGVATVPALRTTTELWQQNFNDVAEKGIAGLVNRRNVTETIAKTKSLKDLTYQSLTAIAKGVGLPFPMTEQIVGDVVDRVPSGQQLMDMAKRFGFGTFDTRSGISSGEATPRQSTGAIYEPPASTQPRSLTELRQQVADFNQRYESGQIPKQSSSGRFAPIPNLSAEQTAADMGMTLKQYREFQSGAERAFAPKQKPVSSGKPPRIVRADDVAIDQQTGQRINMKQYRKASKEWRKLRDTETAPLRQAYDDAVRSGDKELQSAITEAINETEARLPKAPARADFAMAKPEPPKKSSGGFGKTQPKQSTFIAESAVEAAAQATGASTAQVKAQIASQRASGQAPDLAKATAAIAPKPPSSAPMSMAERLTLMSNSQSAKPQTVAKSRNTVIQSAPSTDLDRAIANIESANPSARYFKAKDTFSASNPVARTPDLSGAIARIDSSTPNLNAIGQPRDATDLDRAIANIEAKNPRDTFDRRSLRDMQSATVSNNRVNIGDRIGFSGIGLLLDTGFAAQVLTEASSRGEKAPTALSRAGISAGSGYAAFAAASYIPNPYLRTAAQVGLGIAAVTGADKAIDQFVGRDAAREDKFAKDLSKLDLAPTKESEQWKPFADDNLLGAYGNSFVAQVQSNLDYRPAARSLANLANRGAIDNARYASERAESIEANQQLGAGGRKMTRESGKSIVWREIGNGQTEAIMRDRPLTSQESRILAMQNLVNESGYEVPRTGKLDTKTVDALKKLGYSTGQIGEYIHGKSMTIGKPENKPDQPPASANQQSAKEAFALRKRLGQPVTSSQLSSALSAERKAQGLKHGERLSEGTVGSVFNALTGRSLRDMRSSVGGNATQSALKIGAGIGRK